MNRRFLVVDIDDVLADFYPAFVEFARAKYNFDASHVHGSFIASGIKMEWLNEFSRRYLVSLKPKVGAQLAIATLHNSYRIVACTSRPDEFRTETAIWIGEHFPQIETIYFSAEKGKVCTELDAVALIEDQPHFAAQYHKAILIEQPWNEGLAPRGDWMTVTMALTAHGR